MEIKVLYEDNHLIAVHKAAGTLVQGDKTGIDSLMEEVKKFLKEKYKKPGNVFLGLMHRLDRNVEGIVLFAKTSKGASRISEQFREHTVEKVYHAWVSGILKEKKNTLVDFLVHDEDRNVAEITDSEDRIASRAELKYEVVREDGEYSLLKVTLKTGRHHQIRVQLSHVGHPIVGDIKYGSKIKLPDQLIVLKETSLSFTTATTEERRTITLDVPIKTW